MFYLEYPNLSDIEESYHLLKQNNHYVFDGNLEQLFDDSDITVGKTPHKAKDWSYDNSGWLIGCNAGDYLETIELIQNETIYFCKVFSEYCGEGLDYTLELSTIQPATVSSNSYSDKKESTS